MHRLLRNGGHSVQPQRASHSRSRTTGPLVIRAILEEPHSPADHPSRRKHEHHPHHQSGRPDHHSSSGMSSGGISARGSGGARPSLPASLRWPRQPRAAHPEGSPPPVSPPRATAAAGPGPGPAVRSSGWAAPADRPRPDDRDELIELNVGGELMRTTRSTLLQVPSSRLAALLRHLRPRPASSATAMASGSGAKGGGADTAHGGSKGGGGDLAAGTASGGGGGSRGGKGPGPLAAQLDGAGRIALDLDPGLFGLVLRYLRDLKDSGDARRAALPRVAAADKPAFRRMLAVLGLPAPRGTQQAAGPAAAAPLPHSAGAASGPPPPPPPQLPRPSRPAGAGSSAVAASSQAAAEAAETTHGSLDQSHAKSKSSMHCGPRARQHQARGPKGRRALQERSRQETPGGLWAAGSLDVDAGSGSDSDSEAGGSYLQDLDSVAAEGESFSWSASLAARGAEDGAAGGARAGEARALPATRGSASGRAMQHGASAARQAEATDQEDGTGPQGPGVSHGRSRSSFSSLPRRPLLHLAPPPTPAAAAVSQLFYISTDYNPSRGGLRVSVYTEADLNHGSAPGAGGAASVSREPFDIVLDATYGEGQLSLTFVARRELPGGMFLGLTSKSQLDRKGSQIPCYGWKSSGSTYNDHTGGGRLAGGGATEPSPSSATHPRGPAEGGAGGGPAAGEPLWKKGDSVELILRPGPAGCSQLLLKVNGRHTDLISRLPSSRNWCWYVGLWAGGDVSCAAFQRDQYAVYWGSYSVKRFL